MDYTSSLGILCLVKVSSRADFMQRLVTFASPPVDFYFPSSCFFGHFLEHGVCQEVVCTQLRVLLYRPAHVVCTVDRPRASSGSHESPVGLRRSFWTRNSATAAVFTLAFSYPSCKFVICLELRGFFLPARVGARGADVTAMTDTCQRSGATGGGPAALY